MLGKQFFILLCDIIMMSVILNLLIYKFNEVPSLIGFPLVLAAGGLVHFGLTRYLGVNWDNSKIKPRD